MSTVSSASADGVRSGDGVGRVRLESGTEARTLDRRDDWHVEVLGGVEGRVEGADRAFVELAPCCELTERTKVDPAAERALAPPHDNGTHLAVLAGTLGGVAAPMLVPDPLVSKALYDISRRQFMPRLGVVYRFSDTTVLRIGAGNFYSPQQTNNFNILGLNPPFSGSTVFNNDRNRPTATIQNPFAGSPASAFARSREEPRVVCRRRSSSKCWSSAG